MATERRPVAFNRFGGLRLDLPLDEVGPEQAILARDVDWDSSPGVLRPRDGFQKLKSAEATGTYQGLFAHSDSVLLATKVVSEASKKLVALGFDGVETGEIAWTATAGKPTFARFGTPSASYTYARAGYVAAHAPVRYDGAVFTTPTATVDGVAGKVMPRGTFMLAWPEGGNRLIAANTAATGGPNAAASSVSHVWFSDPGNAESWHTVAPEANYVQLSPGDGEEITGMCAWNGQIFVFKATKFYVFYGVSTDNEGAPVFNFRTVELGKGTRISRPARETLAETSDQICCATDVGVFLCCSDGIYVTTGGQPEKISQALKPLEEGSQFTGPMATFLSGETESFRWPAAGICSIGRRIYVKGYEYMLVYDLDVASWVAGWKMKAVSFLPWTALSPNAQTKTPGSVVNG